MPGANGGRLNVGNPGNVGGTGRPPNELRERLRGSYAERLAVLESFADGEAVEKAEIPFAAILPHVHCPKCETQMEAKDPAALFMLNIEGKRSARVAERLGALDQMAKYGLGTTKEITVEDVRGRVAATLDVIRATLPRDAAERVIAALKPVWA